MKLGELLTRVLQRFHKETNSEIDRATLELLEQDKLAKVLDCGCEAGELTMEIGLKIGTSNLSAVEIIEQSAKLAEDKGIKVYRADLNERLPFEDEAFDVVYSNQTLEHLYNTDTFIKEVWRVLSWEGTQ